MPGKPTHRGSQTSVEHRASRVAMFDRLHREGAGGAGVDALRLLAEIDLELALMGERFSDRGTGECSADTSGRGDAPEAVHEPIDFFDPGV